MKTTRLFSSALLGSALLLVLSCGDPGGVGVDSRASNPNYLTGTGTLGLLPSPSLSLCRCTPLPADTTFATIGPEGGTVQVGAHALWVPPGALDTAVNIIAFAPSDTVNRVRFWPEGLAFKRPAYLMMSYANCEQTVYYPRQIAYTTDLLELIYYLLSVDHLPSQTVVGRMEHFSTYAVAW